MKNTIKKLIKINFCFFVSLVLSFLIISNKTSAHSVDEHLFSKIYTFGDIEYTKTKINISVINGENIIFLPSTVSPDSVSLFADFSDNVSVRIKGDKKEEDFKNGIIINLNEYCSDPQYVLSFLYVKNGNTLESKVKFVFSENISSIIL